jgi:hypothetical protein
MPLAGRVEEIVRLAEHAGDGELRARRRRDPELIGGAREQRPAAGPSGGPRRAADRRAGDADGEDPRLVRERLGEILGIAVLGERLQSFATVALASGEDRGAPGVHDPASGRSRSAPSRRMRS